MAGASANNLVGATLTVQDGAGTPNTLSVVLIEDGGFEYDDATQSEIVEVMNFGAHHHRLAGKAVVGTINIKQVFQYLQGQTASDISLREAMLGVGQAAAWVTVDSLSNVFHFNLILLYPQRTGDAGQLQVTFSKCVLQPNPKVSGYDKVEFAAEIKYYGGISFTYI